MDKKIIAVTMALILTISLTAANDYIIQDSSGNKLFTVNNTGKVTVNNGNLNLDGNSLQSAQVPWSSLNSYPAGCDPDEAINQVGDTVDCVALDAGGVVNTTGGAQNEISFFLNNDTVTSDSQFYWDSSNNRLGVGVANPSSSVDVSGGAEFTGTITLNSNQIAGLQDPDDAQDAATKSYVETYADNNDDTGTDSQTLSTTVDTSGTDDDITISNGNTITIDDDYAADDQNLGTSGNQITLDNGGSITPPYAANADTLDGNQPSALTWNNLGIAQSDISVSNLGSADTNLDMNSYKITNLQDPDNAQDAATKSYVETYADNNDNTGTDNQNLQTTTRAGDTVTIPLEDGGSTSFTDNYEVNTDTQDLSVDSSSQDDTVCLDNGGCISIDDDTTSNTDEQVAVDSSSSPGYLGSANDGVLRPNSELSYVDNGDYITLGVQASNIQHDSLANINYNDHHGIGNGIRWDGSNNIALDADDLDNNGNINDFSAANDLDSSGNIDGQDANHLMFTNQEEGDYTDGGDIFYDRSAGLYVYYDSASNSPDGSTGAGLMWNNKNVNTNSGVSISYDGEQEPTIGVNEGNLDCSAITGSSDLCDGTDNTIADDQDLSIGSDPSNGGATTINIDGGNSATFTDDYEANTDTQDLSISGDTISLDRGGSVTINDANNHDDQTLSKTDDVSGTNDEITITEGNTITIDDDYEANTDAATRCNSDQVLEGGDNCVSNYEAGDDGDSSSSNEIQNPTVTTSDDQVTVSLDNGGGTDSASITDDNTQLDDEAATSNVNLNKNQLKNAVLDKRDCSSNGPSTTGQIVYCTNLD